MKKKLVTLAALCAAAAGANAGEIYTGVGLPGLMLGYAQPISGNLTLRGDVATLGTHSKDGNREGVNYTGTLEAHRAGLFADWFPTGGGFRLTGGVTLNDIKLRLDGQGDGNGTITIGNRTYPYDNSQDRFRADVEFPRTTPYLGLGWGHQASGPGFGFVFDLGVSIGKPKVTITTSGPNLSQVSQDDIDRESRELRETADKIKAIPQLSVGVSYRF